ncbi:MAG: S-layer homology domain-containing protein [Clostridiales bacterium]|nr:S-layer homology domain-containing protein [Clostridiales bacterium]
MKRNLSSQAIRAMAIGMAVTLGSATAVSGVVTGTVVNVYAAAFPAFTNVKAVKESDNLKITIPREKTNVFKLENTKKLTGLIVTTESGTSVFSSDDGGTINNVIVEAGASNESLVIKIPVADIKDGSLDGSETALKITKLTGTDVKYGASGSESAMDFSGNLDVTADNAIGIDKKAPTLVGANATYANTSGTPTVEVTLTENLTNRDEQTDETKFTIVKKGTGTDNVKVSKYKAENGKLVLTLDKELAADTYTITYAVEDAELKDAAGNKLTQASNNTVEVTVTAAPPVSSAPVITKEANYDKDTKTITLTSDKELKNQNATADKDTHGFVVKNSQKQEQTIKQVTVSGKNITIELEGKDALADDTYTVGYTKKGGSEFITTTDGSGKLDTNENLATFKVSATVKPPVSGDFTATTADGNYTFKKVGSNDNEVALIGFTAVQSRAAQTVTFENGVLNAEGKTYTLTQIGDDSKTAITELTDKALDGHTSNVTTIKEEAFKGNTKITNVSFPKVTSVGANAFNGATALASIDLGSASTGLTVEANAFTGASGLKAVATSDANKTNVEAAIKGSNLQDTTVITDENSNATDATIAKDKFYQTKEGLIFKGLSDKELSFEGKDKFTAPTKPNGLTGETKEKAYLVTYKDGVVSLKAGESTQPPVQESFDVTVQGKKLTFKPLDDGQSVALVSVGAPSLFRAAAANTLQNGVLTVNGKAYNFTQIGDGTTSLGTDFDANTVLAGNLDKVTTVAKDAFKDNTTLTEISLPKVTTIAEGAFSGTSNLAKVFLGDGVVTVGNNAFKGTKDDIKVSSNNEQTINNLKGNNTGLDAQDVENAAPFITSAVINKDAANKVVVTFSEKVYAPSSNPSDFIIEGGAYTVDSIEDLQTEKSRATDTIKLVLNKEVKAGEKITLKYTNSGSKDIKDTAAQEAKLENISTGVSITNNLEDIVVLPTVKSAVVKDGAKKDIVLTLDKAPTEAFKDADKTDFQLTVKGGTTTDQQIQTVTSNDKTITITLNKELKADNTDIKLSYTGKKINVLNNQSVTNEIGKKQPVEVTLGDVKVDGTTLTINVSGKTLKTEPTLGKDGFTVTKGDNDTPVTVSSAEATANAITLTLDSSGIEANDTSIKVKYDGNNSKLVEDGTSAPIAAIKETFVMNEKDTTAPTFADSGAAANGSQTTYTITLPVKEPIKSQNDTITSTNTVVTITGTNSNSAAVTNTVAKVGSDNKSLVLTVTTDKALTPGSHTFKVSYKQNEEVKDYGKSGGNKLAAKDINDIAVSASRTAAIVSSSDSDLVATSLLEAAEVQVLDGKVTVVNSFKGTSQTEIQSMLTKDLTKIASGAFNGISGITLDLSNISVSAIDTGAFNGASNLKISYKGSEKDTYELAKKLGNIEGTTLNNEKPSEVIKDYENNSNNGSGGGSSSGGSGGGSGANIGTITNKEPNTEETTSQGNNNNETVVENKQLGFDVIKLPSVEGEAKVFGDVSANHWAKSYIDKLSTAGIINGSNGMFNPNGQTKRADVTVMLVNLLGLTPEANNKFADVNASAYYAPYVGAASTYGIVNGSNGMFNPQGVISRQDTMVMIAQILKGLNLNVNADTTSLSQFGDASKVSAYANESVAILVNSGIIAGNNGKLNPTAPVTRAEMATIMSKLYDVLASANK